jgi:hypothetical protein
MQPIGLGSLYRQCRKGPPRLLIRLPGRKNLARCPCWHRFFFPGFGLRWFCSSNLTGTFLFYSGPVLLSCRSAIFHTRTTRPQTQSPTRSCRVGVLPDTYTNPVANLERRPFDRGLDHLLRFGSIQSSNTASTDDRWCGKPWISMNYTSETTVGRNGREAFDKKDTPSVLSIDLSIYIYRWTANEHVFGIVQ